MTRLFLMGWILGAGCLPHSTCPPPDSRDLDGDGFSVEDGDCDDEDPLRSPGALEVCESGIDEDCDGLDPRCRLAGDMSVTEADGMFEGAPGRFAGDLNQSGTTDILTRTQEEEWTLWSWSGTSFDAWAQIRGPSGCCAFARAVGDVTGDGIDDVLFGQDQLYVHAPEVRSTVYLLPGPVLENAVVPNHSIELFGEIEDSAGQSLGGPLDFNGDGVGDLLVGTPALMETRQGGAALLWGPITEDKGLEESDMFFVGDAVGQGQGRAVAGVPDIDGDGLDEVLIGQSGGQSWDTGVFSAVLFMGQVSSGTIAYTDAETIIEGSSGEYGTTMSVAGLGDVDGDGYGDWAVGSELEENYAGKVVMFAGGREYGSEESWGGADATWVGARAGDRLGRDISVLGDVYGTGLSGLLMGAPMASVGETSEQQGIAYGAVGPVSGLYDLSLADGDLLGFMGVSANQRVGSTVSGGGDVNGDGYADVLVSGGSESLVSGLFMGGLDPDD